MPGLRSAVHLNGTLNQPADVDSSWTVEVALPWEDFARYGAGPDPPTTGSQWRINFSRVEWQLDVVDGAYVKRPNTPEDNWVWSAQGAIAMHMPERWGYVQFSSESPTPSFVEDQSLPLRDLLMAVYYREKAYFLETGRYTADLSVLRLEAAPPGYRLRVDLFGPAFVATGQRDEESETPSTLFVNEKGRLWSE